MPGDLSYLGGLGEDPSGIPDFPDLSDVQITGGSGIRVHRAGDEVLITMSRSLYQSIESLQSEPQAVDNFSEMAFRCTWSDAGSGKIVVKGGDIAYADWDTGVWKHKQINVPGETVNKAASTGGVPTGYPFYFYLVVPVTTVLVTADDGTGPYLYYDGTSTPSTIEGNSYKFFAETATNWTKPDTAPASYFDATVVVTNSDATHFRLLLAVVPSAGVVQQKTFGNFPLPQQEYANTTSLSVV